MENKKMSIGLALVIIVFLIIGVIAYERKSNIKLEEEYDRDKLTEIDGNVKFDVGEYRFITISEQDIVVAYYKNFINLVNENPKKAWDMISNDCKKDMFDYTYAEFEKYINKYLVSTAKDKYTVEKYKYKNGNRENTIELVDSQNILYKFNEKAVWDYTVDIIANI